MAIGKLGKLIFFFKHEILGHPIEPPYSALISALSTISTSSNHGDLPPASNGIQNGEPKPMAKS